jgi:acyl-CoA synthetase (AMP-forming)/AMP-acid ligase II
MPPRSTLGGYAVVQSDRLGHAACLIARLARQFDATHVRLAKFINFYRETSLPAPRSWHKTFFDVFRAIARRSPGRRGWTSTPLRTFLEAHLARFEVPRYIQVAHAPPPRTASGKILKQELREVVAAILAEVGS